MLGPGFIRLSSLIRRQALKIHLDNARKGTNTFDLITTSKQCNTIESRVQEEPLNRPISMF